MLKVVVLDYTTSTVGIYNMKNGESAEDVLKNNGHRIGDCHYMIAENLYVNITI